jgi:hypothetical protein
MYLLSDDRRTCIFMRRTLFSFIFLMMSIPPTIAAHDSHIESAGAYEALLERTTRESSKSQALEYVASGITAIAVGVYGYYVTAPDPVVKLLYAATQTAGVLTVGFGVQSLTQPSLIKEIDRSFGDDDFVSRKTMQGLLVDFDRRRSKAADLAQGYTSGILAALYSYNGYREKGDDKTIRNIYWFLAANFVVASGMGFYSAYFSITENLSVTGFPNLQIVYAF